MDEQTMHRNDILCLAITTYGADNQIDKAIEEMAELTKALLKLRHAKPKHKSPMEPAYRDFWKNVVEEIADVQIMMAQMEIIFGELDVAREAGKKLARLEQRIAEVRTNDTTD